MSWKGRNQILYTVVSWRQSKTVDTIKEANKLRYRYIHTIDMNEAGNLSGYYFRFIHVVTIMHSDASLIAVLGLKKATKIINSLK